MSHRSTASLTSDACTTVNAPVPAGGEGGGEGGGGEGGGEGGGGDGGGRGGGKGVWITSGTHVVAEAR